MYGEFAVSLLPCCIVEGKSKQARTSGEEMPRLEEASAALEAIAAGKAPQEVESATLDFKEQGRSEGDTLKLIADAALCFANSSGGVVVVGVADRVSGQEAFR